MTRIDLHRVSSRVARPAALLALVVAILAPPVPAGPQSSDRSISSETSQERSPETPVTLLGPVDPASYAVGPGDLLSIRVFVTPPVVRTLHVSPEGDLLLPEGPSVHVAGSTLADAARATRESLLRFYKTDRIEVNLLTPRTFGVYVVGEVKNVGLVEASALDRASEVITRAGGLKDAVERPDAQKTLHPSRRSIRLTRASGENLPVDLGLFEATGSLVHNPTMMDGDRLYVPPRQGTATVSGAVMRSGEYEVVPGDSVATLLALAHGLSEDALPDSAYIESFDGNSRTSTRAVLDLRRTKDRHRTVRSRDVLFVRPRPQWTDRRTVLVRGEVRYPGVHAIPADSMRLTDLIRQAGGFTEDASLREAFVSRRQEDLPADPEFDRLSKLPTSEMTEDEFQYYSLKLRTQRPVVSVDFVALFERGATEYDIAVRSGDEIVVPRLQRYVTVVGEVTRPGNIPFHPNLGVEDYIERSGGYTWRASKGGTAVIRALTGEWAEKRKVDHLGPGDTIWIPRKPRRSYWKGAMTTIGVISQLATIYLVVDSAISN
jgi:protein involved in polysaccharide export with SLBB domain